MLDYIFLISTVFTSASISLFCSAYNRKSTGKRDPQPLYNLIYMSIVVPLWGIIWLISGGEFCAQVLPYSLIFGIGYAGAAIGMIGAIKNGPVALTNLIFQLSLIGTTIWGFFFWGDKPDIKVIIGLILVVLSLFFCLYVKKNGRENKLSLKWLIYVAIAFFCNATATICQKTQQMSFVDEAGNGMYGGMLMFFATLLAFAICLVSYLRSDRSDSASIVKTSGIIPLLAGALNVLNSYLVILLSTSALSPSLIYPVIGVGAMMVVTLFSVFVLKEKITKTQWLGIFLGAVATVLLSL